MSRDDSTSNEHPVHDVDDDRFTPALAAFLGGDADALQTVVEADPEIVHARWNDNTLLEWATQPTPAPECAVDTVPTAVIDILIGSGARLDRALGQAACFNGVRLLQQLLDAGANPADTSHWGITPLESAIMHGSVEAADILLPHGLNRPCLWVAAGAGDLDAVRTWVSDDGDLLRPPGEPRQDWTAVGRAAGGPPSDDPAHVLGEAMVFAAANDRHAVVDHLLAAGVDINARPWRNTTGLHFAVQFQKVAMVEKLVAAGADLTIQDDEYNGPPGGWAAACDDGSTAAARIRAVIDDAVSS